MYESEPDSGLMTVPKRRDFARLSYVAKQRLKAGKKSPACLGAGEVGGAEPLMTAG